jgi:hypothetical protein
MVCSGGSGGRAVARVLVKMHPGVLSLFPHRITQVHIVGCGVVGVAGWNTYR